ncbi:MAG: hypothetical protein BroJett014_27730 [Planctomycetota bacterium]|nr:MAG: hypothetical protein BroJett014_27730 [Planctomycetota bacterium]
MKRGTRKPPKLKPIEFGTGVGQLRRVHKADAATEKEAFKHLVLRKVSRRRYVWRAEHTELSWAWRRIG